MTFCGQSDLVSGVISDTSEKGDRFGFARADKVVEGMFFDILDFIVNAVDEVTLDAQDERKAFNGVQASYDVEAVSMDDEAVFLCDPGCVVIDVAWSDEEFLGCGT